MGQKVLILFCIQLLTLIGLTVCQPQPQILPILPLRTIPARPTLPPVAVPNVYNCTKYSTAKDYWVTYSYNGVPSRYCYLYPNITTYAVSWHEAYDNCRRRGATLLSVHDFATNYILSHPLVLKYGNANQNNQYMGGVYWIGLNSLVGKRGDYRWSDRSPAQFHRWALTTSTGARLPRNIRDQGRCVSMRVTSQSSQYRNYYNNTGLWFKDDCNLNHQYICQRNQTLPPPLPTPPAGGCPTGWFNANQKCIKHINQLLTFEQAKTACSKLNGVSGVPLTIHSQQEQNFITALIGGLPTPYIGLTHPTSYYAWSWTDQSRVSFINWGVQPPVYYYSPLNCVTIVTNSTQPGKWIRVSCKEKHTVLCQTDRNPNVKNGLSLLTQKCNITTGLTNFFQYKKSCYSLIETQNKLSYIDAENHCKTFANTHLVSIVDPFEQAFLKYFISQSGKSAGYLIGLQSLAVSDTNDTQYFQWSDGWPLYYSNWMKNEPRVLRKPQDQCVALMRNTGTGNSWKTVNCTIPLPYICKTSKTPVPKVRGAVNGVCPKLIGNTDKSLAWVNLHKGLPYCYWFSTERKGIAGSTGLQSWADASFHCRRRNGTLASIHSRHTSLIILQRLKNNQNFAQSSYYGSWLGLSTTIEGKLYWEDGSSVGYTNWAPGQRFHRNSSNLNDDSGRICVEMTPDGAWRQAACAGNKRDYFVCQTNKLFAPSTGSTSHAGRTAGIVIGVLFGIGALVALGIYISRRINLNIPSIPSFDNPLSRSRGMAKPEPQFHINNSGATMRQNSSTHSDLTNSGNENPFVGKIIDT